MCNMSIKRFDEIKENSVIDILKMALDDMVSSGEFDERDDDTLYHFGIEITNYKVIKKSWKRKFESLSKYVHELDDKTSKDLYDTEAENLETFKLNDNEWEFIAFSDAYEGYRITITSDNGKLRVSKYEPVGEEECNQYGMTPDAIYKILN